MIDVQIPHQPRAFASCRRLLAIARRVWDRIDGRDVPITIRIASGDEVQSLNARFRQKAYVTDVLTFPYLQGHDLCGGDIIIGIEPARRQAKARRVTLSEECCRLMVHGLSHLAGHHHATRAAFMMMRKIEFETLIQILPKA